MPRQINVFQKNGIAMTAPTNAWYAASLSRRVEDALLMIAEMTEFDRECFWDAYRIAKEDSDDPRTQNCAVIVSPTHFGICSGANCLPNGVKSLPERLARENKLNWLIHAELDAILNWQTPLPVFGGRVMYCPWAACADCAKAIIQSGIRKVVVHKEMMDKTPDYWKESIAIGCQMFEEAGVEYVVVSGKVGGVTNLFAGEVWEP